MSIENILKLADEAIAELENLDKLFKEMFKQLAEASGKEPLPPLK